MCTKYEKFRSKIKEFYKEFLKREADEIGLRFYLNNIKTGKMNIEDVKDAIINSPEHDVTNPHYKYLKNIPPPPLKGFFDDYQDFFITSKTASTPNRLNHRFKALIESNKDIIKEKSILDIASHDGRWSFAALKKGASHVIGIEGRPYLVKNAIKTMKKYGIPKEKYQFIAGDVHDEIKKVEPGYVEVVLCFGFFYHTLNHISLLSEIKRLGPNYLILDTFVDPSEENLIKISVDNSKSEECAVPNAFNSNEQVLVGTPSKPALELMLKNLGFSYQYFDWHKQNILNWTWIGDYYLKKRITLVAKNMDYK